MLPTAIDHPSTAAPRPRRCAVYLPADRTPDGVPLWSPVIEVPGDIGGLATVIRAAARRLLPFFGARGNAVLVVEHETATETAWLIDAIWSDGVAELAYGGYLLSRVVLPAGVVPGEGFATVGRIPTTFAAIEERPARITRVA